MFQVYTLPNSKTLSLFSGRSIVVSCKFTNVFLFAAFDMRYVLSRSSHVNQISYYIRCNSVILQKRDAVMTPKEKKGGQDESEAGDSEMQVSFLWQL